MAQDITLKVAGKPYRLSAATPEMEQLMRAAAADVSAMVTKFDARFPDSSPEDKLVFVAIQEAAGKLSAQKKMSHLVEEVESLQGDVSAYLDGMMKK
ncbi:MAG: cell division protein ZapA [Bacteroidales bacterium]|nr:cell division protein ZapA [Bacteroidales bacterium]